MITMQVMLELCSMAAAGAAFIRALYITDGMRKVAWMAIGLGCVMHGIRIDLVSEWSMSRKLTTGLETLAWCAGILLITVHDIEKNRKVPP
jgi:hypothetical protein